MRLIFSGFLLTLLIQSCTAAAFDKAHPSSAAPEKEFPVSIRGSWEATSLAENFYVDKMAFDATTVTYEMSSIAPDNPASLTLTKDSVELRKMKKDYVFNVAGDGLWICYIIRQPSKNNLEIYGFDEAAKEYVAKIETEDSEQGIEFVKYYATDKEWEKLVKSPALKKVASYTRVTKK